MEKCGGGCLKQSLKSILEGSRLEGMEWSGGGLLSGAEFREYSRIKWWSVKIWH